MSRRLYLLRHAEVDYFTADGRPLDPATVPLNDEGRRGCVAVAAALREVAFDRAVCSGLPRTVETARLVLGDRALPLTQDGRWREIEPGRMTDLASVPPEMVKQAILGSLSPASEEASFLGGETFAACRGRALEAWADLLAGEWSAALVVAHGVVNRLVLLHALGAPFSSLGRLEQDAGCVNLIEWPGPVVRAINVTPDDPGKVTLPGSTMERLYRQYLRGRSPKG